MLSGRATLKKISWIVWVQALLSQQLQRSPHGTQVSFGLRRLRLWRISRWDDGRAFVRPLFHERTKMLSLPDGLILYGKLRFDIFSSSELRYPNMKKRPWPIRARLNFYLIGDNPNISLAIVGCSLYTLNFSSYQALTFADFIFGRCGNWNFTVRLCSTTSS